MKRRKYRDRYAEYPVGEVLRNFSEILSDVQYKLTPVVVSRHDKPVAFLAPMSLFPVVESALVEKLKEEGTRIKSAAREIERSTQVQSRSDDDVAGSTDDDDEAPIRERTVSMAIATKARR